MQTTLTTILITGGGSGIGRGLAEAFHSAGSKVIIAGRRQSALDEVTAANPGMASAVLDIQNAESIPTFTKELLTTHPTLNAVIHNAGIMRLEKMNDAPGSLGDAEATVATNLLGPIRLTAALLPHFLKQSSATIITVSSGLAFLPLAGTPTYCASKAAIHSWTESLRYQLRDTGVEAIELTPPYLQTELMGPRQASDHNAMPLAEFISESMSLLTKNPTPPEILVERVKPLRFAAKGNYEEFYKTFNEQMAAKDI